LREPASEVGGAVAQAARSALARPTVLATRQDAGPHLRALAGRAALADAVLSIALVRLPLTLDREIDESRLPQRQSEAQVDILATLSCRSQLSRHGRACRMLCGQRRDVTARSRCSSDYRFPSASVPILPVCSTAYRLQCLRHGFQLGDQGAGRFPAALASSQPNRAPAAERHCARPTLIRTDAMSSVLPSRQGSNANSTGFQPAAIASLSAQPKDSAGTNRSEFLWTLPRHRVKEPSDSVSVGSNANSGRAPEPRSQGFSQVTSEFREVAPLPEWIAPSANHHFPALHPEHFCELSIVSCSSTVRCIISTTASSVRQFKVSSFVPTMASVRQYIGVPFRVSTL
jgi:hypothetical protein